MGKELSEMTLEELWQLFPIILEVHNKDYYNWYADEEKRLLETVNTKYVGRINHIGSSAVDGLISKPTVDILLELVESSNIDDVKAEIQSLDWGLMHENSDETFSLIYNKGYSKNGFEEKVYHLHVKYLSDWKELYFRDYLIDNPEVAKAYGELKMGLLETYRNDRDGYTEAKSEFIMKYTDKARRLYGDRYKPV